jgi:methylated-DNA-protein-cysteine methyltransferase-like protein
VNAHLTERIVELISAIPSGYVATYGGVAAAAGHPRAARRVVWVLRTMSSSRALPWHRVIRADGSIALPRGDGHELQAALLADEGIDVSPDGRVDLSRHLWKWCRDP